MSVGSLFSGIGGLELGLEMCGVGPVVWQAECDPYARAVLEKHWPEVKRYNDVRDIDETAERPDIICGGFPCQDISTAGTHDGLEGERSRLWQEFARVVRILRPRIVFVENSSALVFRGLDRILADLAAFGFNAEWACLRASDVGAPHSRERIFILAYANEIDGETWLGSSAEHEASIQRCGEAERAGIWLVPTPEACRGTNGSPGRLDIAALGNACVPQQAALGWRSLISIAESARRATPGETKGGG